MTEFHDAVARGDLAEVERRLAAGESPLAVREDGASLVWTAHLGAERAPSGRAVFDAVLRAARDAASRAPGRAPGLTTAPLARQYVLRSDRGMRALRESLGATQWLDVLLLEGEVKVAARELARLVRSPRREADVAARAVADAARLLFAFRLKGLAWTIVPLVVEPASRWSVPDVTELEAPGDGIGRLARALALGAGARVAHLEYDRLTLHHAHGAMEVRSFEVEEWWAPDELSPSAAGATDLAAARWDEQLRRMDEALGELGVLVPPMRVRTDGYHVQLELAGVAPSDVERVDLVVLSELGERAVDRTLATPSAPSAVGPAPSAQPLASPAPPRVSSEPALASPAPPRVSS
ncbi:MAG: hypothetical protein KF729_37985, partial [Sandaracinaceae bacterium]|nr:hypothetical protein [Sandaracinaceae bacterium]